jgi:hypothetical protein
MRGGELLHFFRPPATSSVLVMEYPLLETAIARTAMAIVDNPSVSHLLQRPDVQNNRPQLCSSPSRTRPATSQVLSDTVASE